MAQDDVNLTGSSHGGGDNGGGDGGAAPAAAVLVAGGDPVESQVQTQTQTQNQGGGSSSSSSSSTYHRRRNRRRAGFHVSKYRPAGEEQAERQLVEQNATQTSVDYYFDSYAHHSIHEEMIKDDVRTRSYYDAIMKNQGAFRGKVVLDVGCGTGILSLFAAKAGAKKVIGVDCSTIIEVAREIVKVNGYAGVITLIRGKIEEVTLPVEQVDIIISEWMGYFLLYESMLNSVLFARDKWLKPDGRIFPNRASLHCALIEDAEYKNKKFGFWDNIYGFSFRPVKAIALLEPTVDVVNEEQICTSTCKFLDLDLTTVKAEELAFTRSWSVTAARQDTCHAVVVWFDYSFTQCARKVFVSTDPFSKNTHWKQSVLYLKSTLDVAPGDVVSGTLTSTPNKDNARDLDIQLTVAVDTDSAKCHFSQLYRMR